MCFMVYSRTERVKSTFQPLEGHLQEADLHTTAEQAAMVLPSSISSWFLLHVIF